MTTTQRVMGLGVTALLVVFSMTPVARADFEQAMDYYKTGKFLEAASEFQGLVDEQPDYADGHFMLGICFMKVDKPGDAEKAFLKAIELNPDKFQYYYNLAHAYQTQKNYAKAVSTLNNAEGLAPDDQKPAVYKLRGFAYAAQKSWDEAVDDLERAVKAKPDGTTQVQLGKAYFAMGDYATAAARLHKAIKSKPSAETHRLLAEALMNLAAKATSEAEKTAKYTEALAEAKKSLGIEASTATRYLVARAALGARRYDEAIAGFSEVLESDAGNCNAMANMGKACTAKGDWADAVAALENATRCRPDMGVAWENKGFVLQKTASEEKTATAKQKRYEQAIAAYEKARQINSSPSIDKAIQTCKDNIQISRDNQEMDISERKQDEEIAAANQEFEEKQAAAEKWKELQGDDD